MNLRPPQYSDREWMVEAYADWPNPKDFMSPDRVHRLLRRWIERGDFVCRVAEDDDGTPIGLMVYKQFFVGAEIVNAVVRPDHREKGKFTEMAGLVKTELVESGVVVATFDTLPGPLDGRYPDNTFTADMEI